MNSSFSKVSNTCCLMVKGNILYSQGHIVLDTLQCEVGMMNQYINFLRTHYLTCNEISFLVATMLQPPLTKNRFHFIFVPTFNSKHITKYIGIIPQTKRRMFQCESWELTNVSLSRLLEEK